MLLECDKQSKEERMSRVRENRIENISVVGNVALQCGKIIFEKSLSEVI